MIELNFNPDARTLRQFGVIALFGFGLLGAAAHFQRFLFHGLGSAHTTVAAVSWALAATCGLLALAYPQANRPLYLLLSVVAFPFGLVLSYVVLAILFFFVFAPIGALLRASGRDPMARGFDPKLTSYWLDARPERNRASYFRQF